MAINTNPALKKLKRSSRFHFADIDFFYRYKIELWKKNKKNGRAQHKCCLYGTHART